METKYNEHCLELTENHNVLKPSGNYEIIKHLNGYNRRDSSVPLLRLEIYDHFGSFFSSELPAPINVDYKAGNFVLDYPCYLGTNPTAGISRIGGPIISKIIELLQQNGINYCNCSAFFLP